MPRHRMLRFSLTVLAMSLLIWAWCPQTACALTNASGFSPVDPAELKMTAEPAAPGAPAIILYRELYRDDSKAGHETNYYRIKILTEEGRKYADIEIPFSKQEGNVVGIHARTIEPDGSIVDFDDKVFTKSVVKAKGLKYLAKTFTLPAIQVGCIIEYYYTLDFNDQYIYDSRWILDSNLFTKSAKFSLKPYWSSYSLYHLRWSWQNMPPGAPQAQEGTDHIIHLQLSNIRAFQTEEYMPPEDELKARLDFSYTLDEPDNDVNHFWSKVSKRLDERMESFVGKHKSVEQAVAETVEANDPPEVKLQKLYARVQQMRNTSFEPQKTAEEEKRAKEKESVNADDVWKQGYGSGDQLTWLYLAMVRAAGFDAHGVEVASREHYFFYPNLMQSERVNSNVVLIKLNGKEIFCDPGSALTPFGLLPWPETGIQGLLLDKKGGAWIPVLALEYSQAQTERRANLTLTDTGDLEGTLTVTFSGVEGARLRQAEINADDTERKLYLEGIIKGYIPAGSEVKVTNKPEWKSSALPLVVESTIKVPGWASGAGSHVLVPVGLFSAREKHVFDHAYRVHPIYVEYPYTESDDINIQIPAGWQISSLPHGQTDSGKIVTYTLSAENAKGQVHLARTFIVNFLFLDVSNYRALRDCFQQIKTNDDQQVVLEPGAARVGN